MTLKKFKTIQVCVSMYVLIISENKSFKWHYVVSWPSDNTLCIGYHTTGQCTWMACTSK